MRLFQIQSDFTLPQDANELAPVEVAVRIQDAFSNAKIDWSKGRARAQRRLDELIAKGCPEIIYRGQQSLVDKTFYAEIPVASFQSSLQGYCFGFAHYDGCISLKAYPESIEALKCGSQDFADRLALEHEFYSNFDNVEFRCTAKSMPPPQSSIEMTVSPVETSSIADSHADWDSIKGAIADWRCNLMANTYPNHPLSFPTEEEVHEQLIATIISIGPVIKMGCGKDSDFATRVYYIEYHGWTAVLSIPSVASYFEPVDT